MRRRVLVDARFVTTAPASSHARYLRELTRVWADDAGDLDMILYAPGPIPTGLVSSQHVQWKAAPSALASIGRRAEGGRLWLNSAFTLASLQLRPDLLFFPYPFVPRMLTAPAVVTLHDVCFRTHPRFFADGGQSLDRRARRAVEAARAVIAVSRASKTALTTAYATDPGRVRVIPHGISPAFRAGRAGRDEADAAIETRHQLGRHYLLCVSTHEPRKNLEVVARAFLRLVESGDAGDAQLVLVGGQTDYTARLRSILERSSDALARTRMLSGLSDPELAALYRGARAVLAPTQCEGFGFPVVEALACGTPVLASDLSVFRELVGSAVSYLPVHDVDGWTTAMHAALDAGTGCATREAARAEADALGVRFSWRVCADSTRELLAEVTAS